MKTYGDYRKQIDQVMGIQKDNDAYTGRSKAEVKLVTEIAELKKKLRKEQISNIEHKNMYNALVEEKK